MNQVDVLKHLADLFMQIGGMAAAEPLSRSSSDLSGSQLLALRYILLHPNCTLTSLAQGLAISNPATTKVMDKLERKGLTVRAQGTDRRQTIALLTPEGRAEVQHHLKLQMDSFSRLFATMTESEKDALQRGLEALAAAAVRQWPGWQQLCLRCGTGCAELDCPLFRYRGA